MAKFLDILVKSFFPVRISFLILLLHVFLIRTLRFDGDCIIRDFITSLKYAELNMILELQFHRVIWYYRHVRKQSGSDASGNPGNPRIRNQWSKWRFKGVPCAVEYLWESIAKSIKFLDRPCDRAYHIDRWQKSPSIR